MVLTFFHKYIFVSKFVVYLVFGFPFSALQDFIDVCYVAVYAVFKNNNTC